MRLRFIAETRDFDNMVALTADFGGPRAGAARQRNYIRLPASLDQSGEQGFTPADCAQKLRELADWIEKVSST